MAWDVMKPRQLHERLIQPAHARMVIQKDFSYQANNQSTQPGSVKAHVLNIP